MLERRRWWRVARRGPASPIVSADGSPYLPATLALQWRRAMKRAGLKITLHSLRHTHASTLIAAGFDVLTISRRLGDWSPLLTLEVYGHLMKPDERRSSRRRLPDRRRADIALAPA